MVSLKFLTLLVDAGGFNEMFCVHKVVYVVLDQSTGLELEVTTLAGPSMELLRKKESTVWLDC